MNIDNKMKKMLIMTMIILKYDDDLDEKDNFSVEISDDDEE